MRFKTRRVTSICLASLIGLLSSCTAVNVVSVALDLQSAMKPAAQCYKDLKSDPVYANIHKKLAVDTADDPTDEQLNDSERVSADGLQLGMEWYEKNQVCNIKTVEYASNFDPRYGAIVASWLTEATDIYSDTITNRPTFGHINGRLKALKERERAALRDYLRTEAQNRTADTANTVSDVLSTSLDVAIQVLQARQSYLANAQRIYYVRVPNYHPVHITKTVCAMVGKKISCHQVDIN